MAAALAALALPLAACTRPIAWHPANARHKIVVGSKNFDEQFVLGQIYAQAFQAAGYRVFTRLGWADERAALRALRKGSISAYPEYTGTILQAYGRPLRTVPVNPRAAFHAARRLLRGDGITALPQSSVNDTLAIVMTYGEAIRLGNPRTISDLAGKARRLTVGGHPACRNDVTCFKGVERTYRLRFKRFTAGRQPYDALMRAAVDVAFGFTTDPELESADYVALRDDRHVFPPFRVTLLFDRRKLARLGPDAPRVVEQVQEQLTTKVVRKLKRRVAFDGKKPARVAAEFLRETGLVK